MGTVDDFQRRPAVGTMSFQAAGAGQRPSAGSTVERPVFDKFTGNGRQPDPPSGFQINAIVVGCGSKFDVDRIELRIRNDGYCTRRFERNMVKLVAIPQCLLHHELDREPFADPVADEGAHGRQILSTPGLLDFDECLRNPIEE